MSKSFKKQTNKWSDDYDDEIETPRIPDKFEKRRKELERKQKEHEIDDKIEPRVKK